MTVINSNSTTSWNKTKYTKTVSSLLFTKSVAMSLANTELEADMPDWTTIVRPTTWFLSIQTYTPNNTVTYDNLELGNENLVINDTPMVAFTLDQIEDDDAGWNIKMNTMENVAKLLREYVDWKFFGQILNFGNTLDSTTTLSKTNAFDTVSAAIAELINYWIDETKIVLVMDAFGVNYVEQNAVNSTFALSDKTYTAWYMNKTVSYANLVRSENLPCVWSFIFGATPTDWDTVKINGLTFTMKTTLGTTAWNVLIGASATTAGANLASAINGSAWAGTTYVALVAKTRNKYLRGLTASATTWTVTLTSRRGYRGAWAFAKTMTSASNKFGQFVIYYATFEEWAIHLVMRDNVRALTGRIPWSATYEYLTWSRFGLKVFEDGVERGLIIPVQARAAE